MECEKECCVGRPFCLFCSLNLGPSRCDEAGALFATSMCFPASPQVESTLLALSHALGYPPRQVGPGHHSIVITPTLSHAPPGLSPLLAPSIRSASASPS